MAGSGAKATRTAISRWPEFCLRYDAIELWFDTRRYAQLQLIWPLDHFRGHPEILARLKLRMLSQDLIGIERLGERLPPVVDELPSRSTGLGASEMRMLERIAAGYARVNPLFHDRELRQTRVFDEWEHDYLLDGLAFGLAQIDDFARHNSISRWWGGTKLTNKRLWRWDQDNKVLVSP